MKGVRFSEPTDRNGPPDMYYDHSNNKQIQASPEVLQTNQGSIPLTTTQSRQDAWLVDIEVARLVKIEAKNKLQKDSTSIDQEIRRSLPALVVTRGGAKTNPPPVDNDDVISSESSTPSHLPSSDGSPHLLDFQNALGHAAKEVKLDQELLAHVGFDEDEYQFVAMEDPYPPTMKKKMGDYKFTNMKPKKMGDYRFTNVKPKKNG